MNRAMFRVGPLQGGIRPVFLKDGNRFVGHINEYYGKGCGWRYRLPGHQHWSKDSFTSKSKAIIAMSGKL